AGQVRPQWKDDHLVGHSGHVSGWDLESAPVFRRFRWESLYCRSYRGPHSEIPPAARGGSVEIDRAPAGADAPGERSEERRVGKEGRARRWRGCSVKKCAEWHG